VSLPVIILGGGGHALVLIDALMQLKREIIGYTDTDSGKAPVLGVPLLGSDEKILEHDPAQVMLVNGMGSIESRALRRELHDLFRARGYRFARVIHPSAVVSPHARLEDGVQILAGAVVQPECRLGAGTIVNTGARVDHECLVGAHVHIAPGSIVTGNVRIGDGAHIGAGAVLVKEVAIGARSVVGAGAVVVEDVPEDVTVAGVPARVIRHRTVK